MTKRFFAFGCSYTRYSYATWADYVGVNFDEYYNYGKAGCSNTYIMNKFVETNNNFNFTTDDYIIVMFTGIGRFSYVPKTDEPQKRWCTKGDMFEYLSQNKQDTVVKSFVEDMHSEDWAIYMTWIAMHTIKQILTSKNIPHKFLMAIDNRNYLETDGSKWRNDIITVTNKTKEIYDLLDNRETVDEWLNRNYDLDKECYVWKNNNQHDGHPTQKMHFELVEYMMPELLTDKSKQFFNEAEEFFDISDARQQGARFANELQFKYDKSYTTSTTFI